jgi:capsular exopolysaccharide synthesis family protein
MSPLANKLQIITDLQPKSPVSEAYRSLRTNIDFSSVDRKIQTVMVTSAGAGEGKTTTVVNLAAAYAQADKRTLLIDADLRKPNVHRWFQLSSREGLSTLLANQCSLGEAVQKTHLPNLHVIPSGPIPPNPAELIASQRMGALLNELKTEYDMILIDTPPALAVADAMIMSAKCDGTIIVAHAGKVKREFTAKVKHSLELGNANILGVVLNHVRRKRNDAYYYYYYQ